MASVTVSRANPVANHWASTRRQLGLFAPVMVRGIDLMVGVCKVYCGFYMCLVFSILLVHVFEIFSLDDVLDFIAVHLGPDVLRISLIVFIALASFGVLSWGLSVWRGIRKSRTQCRGSKAA